jgi:hypothetical protein
MSAVFRKLNLKDQDEIVVLNVPQSFETEVANLTRAQVVRDLSELDKVVFALSFVTQEKEVAEITSNLQSKIKGDAVIWFAYPKRTSRKYLSEINRDRGWSALGQAGFEPVRQVAIDEDWSALRFRNVRYIERMSRSKNMAISKQGRDKTSGGSDPET